jgi:hypothetical protein
MTAISPTTPEGLGGSAFPPTFQMTRHILSFLKWRFSSLPPGSYQWKPETEDSPDQTGSEVFMAADTPIRPEVVGQRPAITVLRSHAAFQGAGIGDLGHVDLATGATLKMDIIPTNLMINVLSRLPVEAERLAWFCAEQVWSYREAIIKSEPNKIFLYLGQRPSISPPTPAGSLVADTTDFEWCAVVVAFPVYLQHSTTLVPLNRPVVKHIGFTAAVERAPAAVEPVVLLQGTATMQAPQSVSSKVAAINGTASLPQTGPSEAQSDVPLTVEIDT